MVKNYKFLIVFMVIVFVILIVGIASFLLYNKSKKSPGLNVHYYNNGVEVFPNSKIQSIITPPGGYYDGISFDVYASNTQQSLKVVNMEISDASPPAFESALPMREAIKFRTGRLNYDPASLCGGVGENWIAYAEINELKGYGQVSGGSNSVHPCGKRVYDDDWKYLFNVPYVPGTPRTSCEVGGNGVGIAMLYDCSLDFGKGYLCICEDEVGGGHNYKSYRDTDIDAQDAILTSTSVDSSKELKFTQELEKGETGKLLWSSGIMPTLQFEGQSISFWVNVYGEDIYGRSISVATYSQQINFAQGGGIIFRTENDDFVGDWVMYNGEGAGYTGLWSDEYADEYCRNNIPFPGLLDLSSIYEGAWLARWQHSPDARYVDICYPYGDVYRDRQFNMDDSDAQDAILTSEYVAGYEDREIFGGTL